MEGLLKRHQDPRSREPGMGFLLGCSTGAVYIHVGGMVPETGADWEGLVWS